ncbi:Calcium-dependent protein kinase 29 [Orobanche minor]
MVSLSSSTPPSVYIDPPPQFNHSDYKHLHNVPPSSTSSPPPAISPETPTIPAPPPIGPILGKPCTDINSLYDLGRELGSGGFGVTRLCTEKSTGLEYACKSMSKTNIVPEDVRREIRILEHLTGQPNIVEFKEAYEDEENVYVVMELCSGGDLKSKVGCYSEKEAARVMRQILNMVYVCHFMGVMHRDVKPHNFLLVSRDEDSPLKAIDFGISVFIEPGQLSSDVKGTRYFMAPELLRRNHGKEIDVWSAGATLYMLLSACWPFFGASGEYKEVHEAILSGKIDLQSFPWPLISNSAKDLIRRMLTVDVTKRITIVEALEHPWLKIDDEASDKPIDSAVLTRMKQFRAMNQLKKLAVKVIAENLSDGEMQGLRQMFNNMDTDGSGTITYEELKTGLTNLGSKLREADIQQLLKAADIDKNGTINYIEFITATMHRGRLNKEENLYKAFHHFDKDECGYITRDEVRQALRQYGMDDEVTLDDILDDVDTDNDGKINYEEFVAMMIKGKVDF